MPAVIAASGRPRLQDVRDGECAHLFVLVRTGDTARLLTSRDGARDASNATNRKNTVLQP